MEIEQEPIFKPKTHIPHVITTFKTKRDMHRLYKWIQEHKFIELAVHIEGKELYLLRSEPGQETKTVRMDWTTEEQKKVEAAAKKRGLTLDQLAVEAIEEYTGPKVNIEPDILPVLERISIKYGIPKDALVNYAFLSIVESRLFCAASDLMSGREIKERDMLYSRKLELEKEISAAFEKMEI